MERVVRSEDDIYMLYTGGTTGMPKGVMYRIGDHASLFLNLGYPAVGLAPPSDPSEVPALVRQITDAGTRLISIPTAPLMHGTGLWLGCVRRPPRGWRGGDAHQPQPRRPRGAAHRRRTTVPC